MAKVLVTRRVPGDGLASLRDSGHDLTINQEDRMLARDELLAAVRGCEGLLTQLADKVDAELMDAAGDRLRVISNYAVGYNNIDVDAATQRGIVVCNTPGVLTEATADIAWALILGVARRVAEGDRFVRSGQWDGWAPEQLLGGDLFGRTLAIVGAGRIGHAVARRAAGWDMPIIYVSRTDKPDWERRFRAERRDLDDALREADFISLHVPLNDHTRHLIGPERLRLMKRTAYLINTSRGPVVDEAALVAALKDGLIAGAGLDVYEHEPALTPGLTDCPNALLLPHLGSATIQTRRAMADLAVRNLLDVLADRNPPHAVNAHVLTG